MIKNIIFDIGNVFVRWSPALVIERTLGLPVGSVANAERTTSIFGSAHWLDLNRGRHTMAHAMGLMADAFGLNDGQEKALAHHITDHLDALDGTEDLARRLQAAGYRIFALTDNVHEIVAHLKERHTFWPLFEGVANSADIGALKPEPAIYKHLLETHDLIPEESFFLDDIERNVLGARAMGLHAAVFENARQAEAALRAEGLRF